jgi:hypothetical protein
MRQLLILLSFLLLVSCGPMWYVSTSNHDPVYQGVVVEVDSSTKIDTINSLFQLKRKLRTDFTFRWDFAQYAMNQPLSWYYNNPRLDGIWRPYNRFDVWFNSHQFWTDWAWDYPWYGWSHPWWVRHHRYYNWYYPHPQGWYGWNHYSYSWYNEPLIASNNNYSFVVGRRGSRNFVGNSNIEQDTNRRRNNRVYPNNNNNNNVINDVIRWGRGNNIRVNVNGSAGSIDSNVVVPNRPSNNNNNWNVKPRVPNNNFNSRPPVINNSGRGSNVNINRGGSSSVRSSGNSGGSSRGRGNN